LQIFLGKLAGSNLAVKAERIIEGLLIVL